MGRPSYAHKRATVTSSDMGSQSSAGLGGGSLVKLNSNSCSNCCSNLGSWRGAGGCCRELIGYCWLAESLSGKALATSRETRDVSSAGARLSLAVGLLLAIALWVVGLVPEAREKEAAFSRIPIGLQCNSLGPAMSFLG
jgi:hypothetical protein